MPSIVPWRTCAPIIVIFVLGHTSCIVHTRIAGARTLFEYRYRNCHQVTCIPATCTDFISSYRSLLIYRLQSFCFSRHIHRSYIILLLRVGYYTNQYLSLPYINGLTEPAPTRLLRKIGIQVVTKPYRTLQQEFASPKFRQPNHLQTNVVYNIPCKYCSRNYIGETGRCLQTRKKEHIRNAKNCQKLRI